MQSIGGYFELADFEERNNFLHAEGILLNTGRNALEYILRSVDGVSHVLIPYYTCEAVIEPLDKLHIPYDFYHIDNRLEIAKNVSFDEGEFLIANNYFGIKDAYIRSLATKFGGRLIVDCAQALFSMPIPGINEFYSPRKYVGVADGGIVYLGGAEGGNYHINDIECTEDHAKHLFIRKQFGAEAGFPEFQKDELKLNNQPVRWMSDMTKNILWHIDYERVAAIRRENYAFLDESLGCSNQLLLPEIDSFACPMVYPFLTYKVGLREYLIEHKIFVATYWPNVFEWCKRSDFEWTLSEMCLPLPIDHRYSKSDMMRIIEVIDKFQN